MSSLTPTPFALTPGTSIPGWRPAFWALPTLSGSTSSEGDLVVLLTAVPSTGHTGWVTVSTSWINLQGTNRCRTQIGLSDVLRFLSQSSEVLSQSF